MQCTNNKNSSSNDAVKHHAYNDECLLLVNSNKYVETFKSSVAPPLLQDDEQSITNPRLNVTETTEKMNKNETRRDDIQNLCSATSMESIHSETLPLSLSSSSFDCATDIVHHGASAHQDDDDDDDGVDDDVVQLDYAVKCDRTHQDDVDINNGQNSDIVNCHIYHNDDNEDDDTMTNASGCHSTILSHPHDDDDDNDSNGDDVVVMNDSNETLLTPQDNNMRSTLACVDDDDDDDEHIEAVLSIDDDEDIEAISSIDDDEDVKALLSIDDDDDVKAVLGIDDDDDIEAISSIDDDEDVKAILGIDDDDDDVKAILGIDDVKAVSSIDDDDDVKVVSSIDDDVVKAVSSIDDDDDVKAILSIDDDCDVKAVSSIDDDDDGESSSAAVLSSVTASHSEVNDAVMSSGAHEEHAASINSASSCVTASTDNASITNKRCAVLTLCKTKPLLCGPTHNERHDVRHRGTESWYRVVACSEDKMSVHDDSMMIKLRLKRLVNPHLQQQTSMNVSATHHSHSQCDNIDINDEKRNHIINNNNNNNEKNTQTRWENQTSFLKSKVTSVLNNDNVTHDTVTCQKRSAISHRIEPTCTRNLRAKRAKTSRAISVQKPNPNSLSREFGRKNTRYSLRQFNSDIVNKNTKKKNDDDCDDKLHNNIHSGNHWTSFHLSILNEAVCRHSTHWLAILQDPEFANTFQYFTAKDLSAKWMSLTRNNANWSTHDINILKNAVAKYGLSWKDMQNDSSLCASLFASRRINCIRTKWSRMVAQDASLLQLQSSAHTTKHSSNVIHHAMVNATHNGVSSSITSSHSNTNRRCATTTSSSSSRKSRSGAHKTITPLTIKRRNYSINTRKRYSVWGQTATLFSTGMFRLFLDNARIESFQNVDNDANQ